ncbi:MAG: NAD-dependent dehydratase, partial [Methyloceanibacter sp.]
RSPYPLPLAGLKARRSLLGLDNLVEAVDRLLTTAAPLNRPFIVADPAPLNVAEMIGALRQGLGRRAGLFYIPPPLLKATLSALKPEMEVGALFNSLVADPAALRALEWNPPVATQQGLAALAAQTAS